MKFEKFDIQRVADFTFFHPGAFYYVIESQPNLIYYTPIELITDENKTDRHPSTKGFGLIHYYEV